MRPVLLSARRRRPLGSRQRLHALGASACDVAHHALAGFSAVPLAPHTHVVRRSVCVMRSACVHRPASHGSAPIAAVVRSLCSATPLRRESLTGAEEINPDEISFVSGEESVFVEAAARASTSASGINLSGWRRADGEELDSVQFSLDHLCGCGSSAIPPNFTDVTHLDNFSRARIINFVKRYDKEHTTQSRSSSSTSSASSSSSSSVFQFDELRNADGDTLFHCHVAIPVQSDLGQLYGHGLATSSKDAELLAAMHAEYIIDALGYHIYTLPSMQTKHAEAARKAGRWAPMPDEVEKANDNLQLPFPLRRVIHRDETEDGKWRLIDTKPWQYLAPHHTLLSPCILDPTAVHRLRKLFDFHELSYPQLCTSREVEPMRPGGPHFTHTTIVLPASLTQSTEMVAQGKALDRQTSITLATMHAELIMDSIGVPMFPYDADVQNRHAETARSFGRSAPHAGSGTARSATSVVLPLPLKQLVVEKGFERYSSLSSEEDLVLRHAALSNNTTEFRDVQLIDSKAIATLDQYLAQHGCQRSDPFLVERIGSTYKATVVLPLSMAFGVRGGVGLGVAAADAKALAAMHALDVLDAVGVPVFEDASAQEEWLRSRSSLSDGARSTVTPAADSAAQIPSPPGCRRTVSNSFVPPSKQATSPRINEAAEKSEVESQNAAGTEESQENEPRGGRRRRVVKRATVRDDGDDANAVQQNLSSNDDKSNNNNNEPTSQPAFTAGYEERRKTVDREYWDLTPDTPDGFILVSSTEPSLNVLKDAGIRSPRTIDFLAKTRINAFLQSTGRRADDAIVMQTLESDETNGEDMKRCIIKLPVPQRFGDRIAFGEASDAKDAETLACMHAELILDAIGVPLYVDIHEQRKHAETCAQYGRFAPSDASQSMPSDTPSPPPLRRESLRSPYWEGKGQRKTAVSVSRKRDASNNTSEAVGFDEAGKLEQAYNAALLRKKEIVGVGVDGNDPADSEIHSLSLPTTDNEETMRITSCQLVGEDQLDPVSKLRVQNYLRRTAKRLTDPEYRVEVYNTVSIMHVAEMNLELPPKFGTRKCVGTGCTKRDAEILCWMHAEYTIDALGIHMFNLPGLQGFHARRVKHLGRNAPLPDESLEVDGDTPSPPPLLIRLTVAKPESPQPPSDHTDPVAWKTYAVACEAFVDGATRAECEAFYEMEKIPRTSNPFYDATLEAVEKEKLDKNAKQLLTMYCVHVNVPYPTMWKSSVVGSIMRRMCVTSVEVPGHEHIIARGVAMNKENSHRRAAMHAIELLRHLEPDFIAMEPDLREKCTAEADENKPVKIAFLDASAVEALDDAKFLDSFRSKNKAASGKKKKAREVRVWNREEETLTLEGKIRVINLYTLCFGLPPPVVQQLSRVTGVRVKYTTTVELVDEDGRVWKGCGSGGGNTANESSAYDDLFSQLLTNVEGIREIQELVRQHPHLHPDHVPHVSLAPEMREKIEQLINELPEPEDEFEDGLHHAKKDSAAVDAGVGAASDSSGDRDSAGLMLKIATTPAKQQELSASLSRRHKAKVESAEYKELFEAKRTRLSIYTKKDDIVDVVLQNQVVIVCGTTGCGKTTQVPQFILDHFTEQGKGGECSILVTQPRRLSAVSIAQRVASERQEVVGETCGYSIRLDTRPGSNINFCTSGVLLRLLHSNPTLEGFSVLVIDEIHERDINSDFILILLHDLMRQRKDLRIVLMSATMQSELFARYFNGAPVIEVEGYVYPVQELFLDDLVTVAERMERTTPLLKEAAETLQEYPHTSAANDGFQSSLSSSSSPSNGDAPEKYGFIEATSEIDYPTVQLAIEHAIETQDLSNSSVLVFLPGWDEITKAKEILERDSKYYILCLHSSVSSEEQLKCFMPAPEGKIKIILSTNIAESGVTIDDIGAVVDVGRAKEKSYVQRRGRTAVGRNDVGSMSQLITTYASKANCVQRRGRVGRTRPGMCIRLYSRHHFQTLHSFQTPEMLRIPLDSLCLQILALNLGDPYLFLQNALEPPTEEHVLLAMNRLCELGATTTERQLTPLGAQLAQLPVAPKVGKMIIMGAVLRCLDSALTIAAVSDSDVFESSREFRDAVRLHREDISLGTQSDHIASVNGYNFWVTAHYSKSPTEVMYELQEHTLSIPQLLQVSRYKRQFFDILRGSGVLGAAQKSSLKEEAGYRGEVFVDQSEFSTDSTNAPLVKCVVASGLFPNIAMTRDHRRMRNKLDHSIELSTSSVIRRTAQNEILNPYFVYDEISKSVDGNRVVMRQISSIPLWTLLVMSTSSMSLTFREDLSLGIIDDWIMFRATYGTVETIRKIRRAFNACLSKKFMNPNDPVNNAHLEGIRELLKGLVNAPTRPNDLVLHVWEENGKILAPNVKSKQADTPETTEAAGTSDTRSSSDEAEKEKCAVFLHNERGVDPEESLVEE